MPRPKKVAAESTDGAAEPVAKRKRAKSKKRAPHGSVRETIIGLLAAGSKTRKQLLTEGGFSPASLFNVLKVLKNEGVVLFSADNRMVELSGSAPRPQVEKSARAPSKSTALIQAGDYVARALHEALDAVHRRFVAPDRVGEKLVTLERLASTMPAPIAEVLAAISEDYRRLSPGKID